MITHIVTEEGFLSEVCQKTTFDECKDVIQDLMDTANHLKNKDSGCLGLASNQVGSDLRVFIIKYRGKFIWFINPSFEPVNSKEIQSKETCLSFPGKTSTIKRYTLIKTSPPKKKKQGLILDGITAIAFQHELDHLNGITI